ncbi:MAG: hypothetical protein HYZ93_05430 [Candidatus Omnitrophica bacterium]|nr:hypothetical protein [Candidatus Omnitrophota bacterium]
MPEKKEEKMEPFGGRKMERPPKSGLFYLWILLLAPFLMIGLSHSEAVADPDGATEALQLRFQAELAIAQEKGNGHVELAEAMQQALPELLQEYLVTRDGTIALDTVDAAFVQEQFKIARAMEEPGVALALDVFSGPGTGYEYGLRTAIANLADFNDRAASHVSEAALKAHEHMMEGQMEKMDQALAKREAALDRADRFRDRFNDRLNRAANFTLTVNTPGVSLSVTPSVSVSVQTTNGASVTVDPGSSTTVTTPGGSGTVGFSGSAPGNSGNSGNSGNAGGGRPPR